jgi:hypothetical protein
VGQGPAEDPAGAVDIEDHWQCAGGALRTDDPNRNLAGWATLDCDVLDVDVGLRDRTGLDLVDCLAALGRRKVEQERWLGRGVGECLSCGLQRS